MASKRSAADTTVIYALKHPDTQEIRYIGKTCRSVEFRLYEHCRDAAQHKSYNAPVHSWIRKLAASNMKPETCVLEIVGPESDWRAAERKWIATYRVVAGQKLLNATNGGDGTDGYRHDDDMREKLSEIAISKGRKPPGNLGRKFSDEARANMATAHVGLSIPQSAEARARRRGPCPARNWSPETRAKIMASRANYKATDQHRANLSAAATKAWAAKKVVEA